MQTKNSAWAVRLFLSAKRESSRKREDNHIRKIWTKCEHAKKLSENGYYQNVQTNTCKNRAGKPVFMRGFKGYRRNGKSPFRALTLKFFTFFARDFIEVEMEKARLGRWHWLFTAYESFMHRRNGKSPFRALTPFFRKKYEMTHNKVEMEKARLGRWHSHLATRKIASAWK